MLAILPADSCMPVADSDLLHRHFRFYLRQDKLSTTRIGPLVCSSCRPARAREPQIFKRSVTTTASTGSNTLLKLVPCTVAVSCSWPAIYFKQENLGLQVVQTWALKKAQVTRDFWFQPYP
jgi:hypothetical protein